MHSHRAAFLGAHEGFRLPIAERLYRNRQGLTKGRKRPRQSLQAQTQARSSHPAATGRRTHRLGAPGFPTTKSFSAATAPTAARAAHICRPTFISSAMSIPRVRCTSVPRQAGGEQGNARKKGTVCPAWRSGPRTQPSPGPTELRPVRSACHARRQNSEALYYKAGGDRVLTIVLTRDKLGKRPDQMFYCTKLAWTSGRFCHHTPTVGRSNAPSKTANSFWVSRNPPIACPRQSSGCILGTCVISQILI